MKALLIIDMLNDFIDEKGVLFCGESARQIIPEIKKLIEEFKKQNLPLIYICDSHQENDEEFTAFPPHCIKGTWGAEIISELKIEPKDYPKIYIIPKTRFSGFYKTNLENLLRDLKIKELWLTGVCTSICVMDTAKDAYERGYKIIIPVKAVADFDQDFHKFALERMKRIYKVKLI
ncbi:cysteine hydrolase [Candidatus Pacearchaeota archaeon]|nr:MAG: cysteine hydrolase [Candidatus Pacearchaeota archaeon]